MNFTHHVGIRTDGKSSIFSGYGYINVGRIGLYNNINILMPQVQPALYYIILNGLHIIGLKNNAQKDDKVIRIATSTSCKCHIPLYVFVI